ncbi:MAG: tRNA (N6-threonylcarbamoyladenosine(37)-N6)-methyltransferase TrmO [Bacteroidetes bacterium]|nr:tRNA (N6-threonylcarbamoyladenosine(37)-N6)-methyltransferase TrmO [Bacteroidota bacterium]
MIRTPHTSKYSAPRQPATSRSRSVGVITLNPRSNFEQALHDLDGFGYVWVLFWFDQAKGWKPKVLPPVSDRTKRGLFATRSPHRPNPIGLSLCKLLSVKGRTILVENPDLLDGTPILDIKPYVPHAEAYPRAKAGWIGETHERTPPTHRVVFTHPANRALTSLPAVERSTLRDYVRQTLSRDPFPHAYRRIKARPDGSWVIAVKRWRLTYRVTANRIDVIGAQRV